MNLGLMTIHRQKIAHRDMKEANVLVKKQFDGEDIYKIADFGLATKQKGNMKTKKGTPQYMAPELTDPKMSH